MRIELALLTILCGATAGCLSAPPCLDAEATDKMYDAAWNNEVSAMRELLERDRALAKATGCRSQQNASRTVLQARMSGLTTPLHVAARQGHAEIAKLLLENGAHVDARGANDYTPLHLAALYGHDEVIKVLIAAHATVDARSKDQMTPLGASSKGRFAAAKLLLEAGADVNARATNGWRPLHTAASEGHGEVVRLLLEHGATIDAATDAGVTPLQFAAQPGHVDVVRLLADKGANINHRSNHTTALILALSGRDAEPVRQLLRQGADPNGRDARGRTPLQTVIEAPRFRDEPGKVLDQKNTRLLLDAGADVHVRGRYGHTLLHMAVMADRADLAAILLERGAGVNVRDDSGLTPLHLAAQRRTTALAEVLLAKGADVNAPANDGMTPLYRAWGNEPMKALLERHGARRTTVQMDR